MKKTDRSIFGRALLFGAGLTLLWILVCPKFSVYGDVSIKSSSYTGPNRTRLEPSEILDPTYLIPGLIVIWAWVFGVALIRSSKSSDGNEAHSCTQKE